MKKIDTPRNPRLRTSAVTSASGSVIAVDIAAKNRVRGIAARTSVSGRQADQVVAKPDERDEVILGELDPEQAHPEDREGRREDDQGDEDQPRDRHEQGEPALAQAIEPARNTACAATQRRTRYRHAQARLHWIPLAIRARS